MSTELIAALVILVVFLLGMTLLVLGMRREQAETRRPRDRPQRGGQRFVRNPPTIPTQTTIPKAPPRGRRGPDDEARATNHEEDGPGDTARQ